MKRSLILASAALLAFLTTSSTAGQVGASSVDEGPALGTVVVWNHFTSGKPTGHLRGRLVSGGRVFAEVVARLEDDGEVTGYALTRCGYEELEGEWCYDSGDGEGEFDIEFDIGDDEEIDLEGSFEGTHSYWKGEWEREED